MEFKTRFSIIIFSLIVILTFTSACSDSENISEYYESGELKISGQEVDGRRQGEWLVYDKEGNVSEILTYSNDSLNFRQTFIEGNLAIEEELVDSVRHGELKVYFEDGSLNMLTNYKYGVEQGLSKKYYPNGNIYLSFEKKGDHMIDFKQYYPNGNLFVETKNFTGGLTTFYDLLGAKTYDVLYENGEIVDTTKVY